MTTKEVANVLSDRFAKQAEDLTAKALPVLHAMTAQRIAQQAQTPEFRELCKRDPAAAFRQYADMYTDNSGKNHLFRYMR